MQSSPSVLRIGTARQPGVCPQQAEWLSQGKHLATRLPKGDAMSSSEFARLVEKSKIAFVRKLIVSLAFLFTVSFATVTLGQLSPHDPGVRGGTVDAGQPLDLSKTAGASSFFADGLARFAAVEVVSGQPNNTG